MKINNSTKKSLLIIALAMASTTYQTQAAPIEHIGDRYIMHIPEMELTGEESLLDVLMMCPEVISLDGNNIIGGDPFANLYGKFVIRIDNQEYGLDYGKDFEQWHSPCFSCNKIKIKEQWKNGIKAIKFLFRETGAVWSTIEMFHMH